MNNFETGSSTLVIATIDQKERKLKTALIGDSGFLILRPENSNQKKYRIYFKSEIQQHSFNAPFQVGRKGRELIGDHPRDCVEKEFNLKLDDIVILGTDGIFDNLYVEDIKKKVEEHDCKNFNPIQLSKEIAEMAFQMSKNKIDISPFAERARQVNLYYKGGKDDDISIIVAKIEEDN